MSDYENLMCHASEIVSAIEKAADERLAETFEKREGRPAYDLNGAAESVRHARSLVRQCMHKDDIKTTPY